MSKVGYIFSLFSMLFMVNTASAEPVVKKLPEPVLNGGKPLMAAMKQRHSAREFSKKEIDDQTLSEILWAAWGINRSDGKHTIPTSMNKQDLDVYAVMADGAWLYNPKENTLTQVSAKDLRPTLAKQSYVLTAPLTLVFVGQQADENNARLHAGAAFQNVGLYAASKGLNNVVRAYYDEDALEDGLNLDGTQEVLISHTIGWPQEE